MGTKIQIDSKTLASLIEYAERFMELNDEPADGNCAAVIEQAKRQENAA